MAGGRAALDAIERAGYDVLAGAAARRHAARRLLALLATLRRRRGRVSAAPAIAEAYARCEAITRAQAANFYYGIRLLSRDRRRAMCAVYAFARRVDDIGDGSLAARAQAALLDAEAGRSPQLERRGRGRASRIR